MCIESGRDKGKQVVIHTHFSSPVEITEWSRLAMNKLYAEKVIVRNQAVMQQGVNHEMDVMVNLTKKMSYMNIRPYYVYIHDMVPGCEHLRTTLGEGIELEKTGSWRHGGIQHTDLCLRCARRWRKASCRVP